MYTLPVAQLYTNISVNRTRLGFNLELVKVYLKASLDSSCHKSCDLVGCEQVPKSFCHTLTITWRLQLAKQQHPRV